MTLKADGDIHKWYMNDWLGSGTEGHKWNIVKKTQWGTTRNVTKLRHRLSVTRLRKLGWWGTCRVRTSLMTAKATDTAAGESRSKEEASLRLGHKIAWQQRPGDSQSGLALILLSRLISRTQACNSIALSDSFLWCFRRGPWPYRVVRH